MVWQRAGETMRIFTELVFAENIGMLFRFMRGAFCAACLKKEEF